jgi:hypothetical protein
MSRFRALKTVQVVTAGCHARNAVDLNANWLDGSGAVVISLTESINGC